VRLDVVEIDPAMATVAKEQFEFVESGKIRLILDDGLGYMKANEDQYDVVMFDVDSKDASVGMSCPPEAFVAADTLLALRTNCLKETGVFALNLVCRDEQLRHTALADVGKVFPVRLTRRIPEEVNEVVFAACQNGPLGRAGRIKSDHPLVKAMRRTNDLVAGLVDVEDAVKSLKIAS